MSSKEIAEQLLSGLSALYDIQNDRTLRPHESLGTTKDRSAAWDPIKDYFDPENHPSKAVWRRLFVLILRQYLLQTNFYMQGHLEKAGTFAKENGWVSEYMDAREAMKVASGDSDVYAAIRMYDNYRLKIRFSWPF